MKTNKPKHTSGPWRLSKEFGFNGKGLVSVYANDETTDKGPSVIATTDSGTANLVAAAPEMLAMLELIVEQIDNYEEPLDSHKWIRSKCLKAINKAKGDQ